MKEENCKRTDVSYCILLRNEIPEQRMLTSLDIAGIHSLFALG